jgi:putative FmdB family regulatory protein
MPIYEYRCDDCSKDSSIFVRSPKTAAPPKCEHCGSAKVARKVSAVARRRGTADVVGEYGSDMDPGSIRDPRQIGHWVEKRFEQFDVEMPKSSRDMIDAAREGVLPPGLDV